MQETPQVTAFLFTLFCRVFRPYEHGVYSAGAVVSVEAVVQKVPQSAVGVAVKMRSLLANPPLA